MTVNCIFQDGPLHGRLEFREDSSPVEVWTEKEKADEPGSRETIWYRQYDTFEINGITYVLMKPE